MGRRGRRGGSRRASGASPETARARRAEIDEDAGQIDTRTGSTAGGAGRATAMSGTEFDPDAFDAFEAAGWDARAEPYDEFWAPITVRAAVRCWV